jgi:RIP metalloprotease RseP
MTTTIFGFLIAIFFLGLCIFVHELGHFLAAKWRGLHIIAFSIGFKKIWSRKVNGIEYRIGCIPCGGYVDLPQIDSTGEAKDEFGNPLPPAKPIDKIITAVAGPLFNIFFGILLSVIVWTVGVPQDTPNMSSIIVQSIDDSSPEYKAGLRDGDAIIKINGSKFYGTWSDFVRKIIFSIGDVTLTVKRDGKTIDITYRPIPNIKRTPNEKIAYPFFLPEIPLKCKVDPDTAVAKAGMMDGDVIVKVNGLDVNDISELQTALTFNRGEQIHFTVRRNNKLIPLASITPVVKKQKIYRTGLTITDSFKALITSAPKEENAKDFREGDQIIKADDNIVYSENVLENLIALKKGNPITFEVKRGDSLLTVKRAFPTKSENLKDADTIKITYSYSLPIWIQHVMPDSPAAEQGLKKYDRILKINGQAINSLDVYSNTVKLGKGKPIQLLIERDGKQMTLTLTPAPFYAYSTNDIGLKMVMKTFPTPIQQFERVITMTYKSLRGIFSKENTLKTRHLSGPLGIINGIGVTFSHAGIMPVLALTVLITYSLAILNLMPLPVLDGGHIVLAVIEEIRKKPMSPKVIQPVFTVFVVFLISMMLYVSFYDIIRLKFGFSKHPDSISKEYVTSGLIQTAGNGDNKNNQSQNKNLKINSNKNGEK